MGKAIKDPYDDPERRGEPTYKIVKNLGYETKDKKQTVVGEILESRIPELEDLMVVMAEEAISVKLDYEQNASNMDSGSMVVIHQNSPLLDNVKEKLSDIAVNIKRKEK